MNAFFKINSVLLSLILWTSASHALGVISGGGAGFPELPKDVHFNYDCTLSITERVDMLVKNVKVNFNYSDNAGSNSGVLQLAPKAADWSGDTTAISMPLDQQSIVIAPAFMKLSLTLDSETVISDHTRFADLDFVYTANRLHADLSQTRTVNGIKTQVELAVACKKKQTTH